MGANRAKLVVAGVRLGSVEEFALDCIVPEPKRQATCSEIFRAYRAWCTARDLVPLREALFTEALEALAREAAIPIRQRGSNLSLLDAGLRDAPT